MKSDYSRGPALRRIAAFLLCLILLPPHALCAQARPATLPSLTAELKGRRVEEVRILGNSSVSSAIIRNLIRTREGDRFDPATAQEDYQRASSLANSPMSS